MQFSLAAWKNIAHCKPSSLEECCTLKTCPYFPGYWVHADPPPDNSVGLEDPHLPYTDNLVNCQQMRLGEIQTGA